MIEFFISAKKDGKDPLEAFVEEVSSYMMNSLNKLIEEIFTVGRSMHEVIVNGKKYGGSKNLIKIQKTILFIFLEDTYGNF